jgi:hypothetical protein
MAKNKEDRNDNTIKPFVKPGEQLGFVGPLKERGMWPPRLHDPKENGNRDEKATTPYLVIPANSSDMGQRPQPNSIIFHSEGIWLEDNMRNVITTPVLGGKYVVKCRVRNLGAFASMGGLADFFVNTPAAILNAAATNTSLPALGHTGFSVMQNDEEVVICPKLWQPVTDEELTNSIVVHAYDPFSDTILHRFNAAADWHVGRHDFAPDFYVRDWTSSPSVHDRGQEPSSSAIFYATSDVWNRRTNAPGSFINGQPQNQNPQAGNGANGDNFMFARISRNSGEGKQTVSAHFMFAEFGTGSPYLDCSTAADPSITFMDGDTEGIISLPWHLHPSASTHLCIAVQIYTDADPYVQPGLSGYTPGWPTTDMMVINDNNKAQRNIAVWDGVPDAEGMQFARVFNGATFTRDVTLSLNISKGGLEQVKNPLIGLVGTEQSQQFKPGDTIVLKGMLPGETRWVSLSYDSFSVKRGSMIKFYFNELEDGHILNGFAFTLLPNTINTALANTLVFQSSVFYRLAEGMGVSTAKEGVAICQRLQQSKATPKAFIQLLPSLLGILDKSLARVSANYDGIKDVFSLNENLRKLSATVQRLPINNALAQYNKILHQADTLQTMAVKSRGDEANIVFTVRLQRDLYSSPKVSRVGRFDKLVDVSENFISRATNNSIAIKMYPEFLRASAQFFEETVGLFNNGVLAARYKDVIASLSTTPAQMQMAHLKFLNALELSLNNSKPRVIRKVYA